MSETLADTGEFVLIDRINNVVKEEGITNSGLTTGIGDDAASFMPGSSYEILVTCDSMVEGRHYLPDHISPRDLGRRAMVMNISDIGAMGGRPLYAVVSLGLRSDTALADVEEMYRGFLSELNPFKASLIGGNITKSDYSNFIDITLIGEVDKDKKILRSTARKGDILLVTGYPGQAAAGLEMLLGEEVKSEIYEHPLVLAYNRPVHRAREGRAAAQSGFATSMIDISDGFPGDLGHICKESGVGAEIIKDKLPVSPALNRLELQEGRDILDLILKDSDDYELIITCRPENKENLKSVLKKVSDNAVTEVGRITGAEGEIKIMLPDGSIQEAGSSGWDHFKG